LLRRNDRKTGPEDEPLLCMNLAISTDMLHFQITKTFNVMEKTPKRIRGNRS
jgi:hypothetical protein